MFVTVKAKLHGQQGRILLKYSVTHKMEKLVFTSKINYCTMTGAKAG